MKASDLFNLPESLPFADFFEPDAPPWEWVSRIKDALEAFDFSSAEGQTEFAPGVSVSGPVFIHPTVKFPHVCSIAGPVYIGAGTEIRPGAFIRSQVIVGKGCILGNSCEYKNCLLMDKVETAHFNYVGDSILGSGAHLGAGAILANLRLLKGDVAAHTPDGRVESGLRKLGAMLGEKAEVGCNTVLQPGTIIGKRSLVMAAMAYGGYLPDNHVARSSQQVRTFARPD